jgi:hypothetical protein
MKLAWLIRRSWLCVLSAICLAGALPAWAQSQSYVNSSDTYNWIDASTHNRIRAYSPTYTYPENSVAATVTITVASPGVVTWAAHGLAANTIVNLSTTGALPTGYTAGTTYYVRNPTANTFQLSASSGGASINTTGVQSGVHTARAQTSVIAFPRTGPPYFFYTPTGSSCGTSGTILDDRLTDEINIGFTFRFGGLPFTKLRVSSNGRVQFNNNLTCGSGTDNGTPTIYTYDYPDGGMNYSMRIYGADLDSTPRNFRDGLVSTPLNPAYATSCLDDGQCYVSVATIGTAPSRKFVIIWNNVPKWVNAGLIAGNFNLQIILEEGGDFVYQFGLVSDTQPNVPAQIGWQVNTNDFDVKQTALPTNNTAIRYTEPRPLLQYQMEQASWSTAAGEVLDSSGNDRHGTRLGAAQTIASGYACFGANIPTNASTGVIDGIDTNFNLTSGMGSAGTVTFWYKPTTWVGNSAGAVNGMLLDASNAANAWFYVSKLRVSNTTTKLRFAVRDNTGNTRVVETTGMGTGVLNANGWVHIGLTWNFNTLTGTNQDRLRIYINGSAIGSGNSVQSLFTSTGALAAGIDTLTIGDNRSSFVDGSAFNGSTNGTGNSANGVIDEFRLYNLEAGLSQVLTDFTRPIGCSRHYAISHAGSGASPTNGRTCVPNTVTIISHTDTDVPIQTASTINLSTSTGQGTWALTTGLGTFTPGAANSGMATYRFSNESQVVLTLNHTTTALVNINVSDGAFSEKPGAEDADLNIVFCANPNFNGCEYTSGRCTLGASGYDQLFTKLAGRDFKLDALTISLSNTLETAFNGTVAVDLLANTSPTAVATGTNCPATQTAVVPLGNITFANGRFPSGGVVVPANAFTSVTPSYSAYRDVRMRFTCNSTNCPPSGATVCSRDAFAVRPAGFNMGATTTGSPALSLLNPASVTSGANRVTAGAAFNVTAQALTAATPAANALGYNGTPRIPTLVTAQSVSAQSSAVVTLTDYTDRLSDGDSDLTIALFTSATTSSGQAGGQLYYLDYGGFRVLAGGLQDPAYVDPGIDPPATDCVANSSTNTDQDADPDRERFGCVVASQNNSALIGRFSPARFVLNSSSITGGCPAGGFTYEGQPFGLAFTASAMTSPVGTVLPNGDVMPRYAAGTVAVGAENGNDGVNRSTRVAMNLAPAPVWTNGVYVANAPAATFSRPNAPDGPFDALDIGVQISDPDGATLGAARNMLPTNNTVCTAGTCTHQKLVGSPIRMRYGRLRMRNAYGSELLALPMSLTAEYWTSAGWLTNTLDGCTSVPVPISASGLVFGAGNLAAGETSASIHGATTGSGTFVAGDGGFRLSAPGSGNTGFVTITIATPDWLEFPWVTAGVNADASARATFGLFKSPLIYRRENY